MDNTTNIIKTDSPENTSKTNMSSCMVTKRIEVNMAKPSNFPLRFTHLLNAGFVVLVTHSCCTCNYELG